ncbi:MAG: hypothetical protein AUG51_17985 [Acidobacteria bacterium 13_1_20CM_3_53_8]|nr:MAG: hypothetical protein AUG51_17985 [Acidobacteria bacterium 13_1_20CM_3_53_8]
MIIVKEKYMRDHLRLFSLSLSAVLALFIAIAVMGAQTGGAVVLAGADLTRVVPTSFYFAGQSAPTQMRNSAAARFGANRYVIAGLVDTSGYSADVRAVYEGFLITDSKIKIGDHELDVGAYGFGFTEQGQMNILDLANNKLFSVPTSRDARLRRPRPLMMMVDGAGIRLYDGRDYVLITAK